MYVCVRVRARAWRCAALTVQARTRKMVGLISFWMRGWMDGWAEGSKHAGGLHGVAEANPQADTGDFFSFSFSFSFFLKKGEERKRKERNSNTSASR